MEKSLYKIKTIKEGTQNKEGIQNDEKNSRVNFDDCINCF